MTLPAKRRCLAGHRALSQLVVLLCLIGQASSFAHFLVVQHSVCAAHGELIHAGEIDDRSVPRTIGPAPGARAMEAAAPTAGDDEHDHCAMPGDRRVCVAAPSQVASVAPRAEVKRLAMSTRSSRPVAIPLLRLAPKNSPPTWS